MYSWATFAGSDRPIGSRNRKKKSWWPSIDLADMTWLNRRRVIGWSAILLLLQLSLLCAVALWSYGVFGHVSRPISSDFISFYAAGKLAVAGTPALAYDQIAHAAAENAVAHDDILYQFFFYPPIFLLLCAPLAFLPYIGAFTAFVVASLGAWLLVMRSVLRQPGWTWCIPVLAFPSVFWTLGQGQNSFLTAALLGAMTLLLDSQPVIAGILLGLVCYKPHLALLVPIALAAGGYWRTFAAAAVTVAVMVGLSVALFGAETWHAYLQAMAASQGVYESGRIDFNAFVTPYGAARVFGFGASFALVAQIVASLGSACVVGWIWRRNPRLPERAAALMAGILLSIPLALVYDMLILLVAIAWLVRESRDTGFLPFEKLALGICFLVPLVSRHLGRDFHIPVAPVACLMLLAFCVVRTLRTSTPGAETAVDAAVCQT